MPTVAELVALPYSGPSSFANGLIVDDYRREYLLHGETIRWFKAFQVAPGTTGRQEDGRRYVEQVYCADGVTLVSAVRAMPYSTREDIEDAEFGFLPAGSTAIGVIPDEIPLARLDRVVLVDRRPVARRTVTRAASGDDSIFNDSAAPVPTPVVAIKRVWQGTTTYTPTTQYTLVGNAVHWVSGAPTAGSTYGVEVTYNPVFAVLGHNISTARPGVDGELLPLLMPLKMEQPGQA